VYFLLEDIFLYFFFILALWIGQAKLQIGKEDSLGLLVLQMKFGECEQEIIFQKPNIIHAALGLQNVHIHIENGKELNIYAKVKIENKTMEPGFTKYKSKVS